MLKKIGLSIIAVTALATTINASAETVYHVTGDTDYASATTYSTDAYMYITLNQVKSNSGSAGTSYSYTRLFYYAYTNNGEHYFWSGTINNSDVSGDGNGNLTLNTNTCTYTSNSSCGQVHITWKKNDEYSTHSSGVTRTDTPYYVYQETGTSTSHRSTVNGTVNGINLDGYYTYAYQGSRNSTNLTITTK